MKHFIWCKTFSLSLDDATDAGILIGSVFILISFWSWWILKSLLDKQNSFQLEKPEFSGINLFDFPSLYIPTSTLAFVAGQGGCWVCWSSSSWRDPLPSRPRTPCRSMQRFWSSAKGGKIELVLTPKKDGGYKWKEYCIFFVFGDEILL